MTKTHILDEIRRTASENGGKALSWRRFAAETGIKFRDWSEFWARWSEAIREAGFEPNKFTAAWDDATLLDCFATLTREIGREPSEGDLRVRAYSAPDFPSKDVFRRLKSRSS